MSMCGPIISGSLASGGTFRPFLLFGLGFPLAIWATRLAIPRHSAMTRSPIRHVRDMVADMRASNTMTDYLGVLTASLLAVVVSSGVILTATPLFLESEFGVTVQVRGAILACFQGGCCFGGSRIQPSGQPRRESSRHARVLPDGSGVSLDLNNVLSAPNCPRSGGHRIWVGCIHVVGSGVRRRRRFGGLPGTGRFDAGGNLTACADNRSTGRVPGDRSNLFAFGLHRHRSAGNSPRLDVAAPSGFARQTPVRSLISRRF